MTEPTRQTSNPNHQSYFLTAYRDHLLSELAEVQRRLAEAEAAPQPMSQVRSGLAS